MQSNITFKSVRKSFKTFMTLGLLLLIAGVLKAQPYINGPLSTGATSSGGTAAPAGFTWSELQGTNTSYGSGANISAGYTLADDFIVPAGQTWNVTKVTFYAYSTGATGTTSPFNDTRVRIFNTNPSTGTPTPVFGNLTTNRFAASTTASMYRIAPGAEGTTRQIWKIEATVVTTLAAGTYWIEWQHGTVTAGASNFSPAKTIPGSVTQAGNNALQHDLTAGTWTPITDVGGAQDFPFQIDYTATGTPCSGTPTPGNTISTATSVCPNIPFTLSVQTATTGLGVTYQWQSGPSATGPWTNIAGATNATYTVANLTATTFYHLVVNCTSSSTTGTSNAVQVATTPASGCYCIPGNSDCSDGDVITNVTFGALNNTSTCSGTGYTNYTTNSAITIPTAIVGATNPITISAGDGSYTESVGVWIDYNHSGSFEANEFTLIGTAANPTVRNGNIVIPTTALTGNTRMRVRVQFLNPIAGGGACTTSYLGYGETEDYTVNLVPCTPVTITTQPVSKTIDCGTNTTFSVVTAGSLPTIYWEYRVSATAPWQNVPATAPYSGQNTATLTVTGATSTLNGYQYRAVYSGACTAVDFSTAATLTVSPLVGTVTPASATICLGSIQQLSITNTQPATVVTFSSAAALNLTIPDDASTTGVNNTIAVSGIPAGVTITNIRIKANITHSWAGDLVVVAKAPNTNRVLNLAYALNATGGTAATTAFNPTYALNPPAGTTFASAAANLSTTYPGTYLPDGYNTITGDPSVPAGPDGFLPTSTNTGRDTFKYLFNPATQLSTAVNGNWTLALYDYYDDYLTTNKFNNWSIEITYTGGLATGVWTSPTPNSLYTDAAATVPYNGTASLNTVYAKPATAGLTNYTVVVNNGTCTSAPLTVPVTVNAPATAVTAVADKATCPGGNTSFTATVTGGFGTTNQWQISTDGGATFTDLANGGVYSGATTSTLTLTNVPVSLSGNKYRLVAIAAPCLAGTNLASAAGTLTVNPSPVVVLGAGPTTAIYPGITTSLTAAVSPNAAASYVWSLNGAVITGQTTNTISGITVDRIGTYTVRVVDVNGCASTSNAVTITDSATSRLFVYPNPTNTGQFHVRFYDAPGGANFLGKRTLTIFDNKGSKVLTREFTGVSPYTDMFIDLKNYSRGIYGIDVTDAKGNRLKTGQVVIQ